MNLSSLKNIFLNNECSLLYVKKLSPNDNSKNQVYLGSSFDILNIFPISDIKSEEAGRWEKERFKAKIKFSWINEEGLLSEAPNTQFILYPKYPEVRFSGFLKGSANAPSELMAKRLAGRVLFLSISSNREILGYVASPQEEVAGEFLEQKELEEHGVFSVIKLSIIENSRTTLLNELLRIHELKWITSKKLSSDGEILPCNYSNCGGYTLEAELGVTPNSHSEPDFMGWEIKQFNVKDFSKLNSSIITLMTPEPTDGIYKTHGVEYFIRNYGYPDKKGRIDRMNFGGIHKSNKVHPTTKLEMRLIGYDMVSGKIRNVNGKIALIDQHENEAASWSFSSLLKHWNRKHDKACYVPSRLENFTKRNYYYGNKVILGTGTDFQLFLREMALGNIYYDPGIKLENASKNPKVKKRSQFRIKTRHIYELYKKYEIINLVNDYNQDS